MMTTKSRWLFACLVWIATLVVPALASAQEGTEGPANSPFPAAAEPIYQSRCANCHGPAGQGDGPQAIQANLVLPDLTDPSWVFETTPARWYDIISNGVSGKAMPPFGEASSNPLRETERWDLVFYLYTLSTPAAQVAMGQALYQQNCIVCHTDDGTGSADVAVDFTDLAKMANQSQSDLFAATADTSIEGHNLELGEVEVQALASYVRTFTYNYNAPSVTDTASAEDAPAVSSPFTGGGGVVSGRVINGTAGSALPGGLVVSLRAFDMNGDFVDIITTTVAADGAFRFEGIDEAAPVQMEPLVVYKDVPYLGNLDAAIELSPEQAEASVDITVFETTQDDSDIRIERLHIVFDVAPGLAQVAELYILSNDGDRTYVGTLEEGTLRLTVPADALDFQPGGDPNRYRTLADGIADTVPIPPGQSTAESVLVYELAYNNRLDLSRPMPYDATRITIFVPADAGVEVTGEGIQPGERFQAQNTSLQTYIADELSGGNRLTLRLAGEPDVGNTTAANLPSPHRRPGPNETQGIAIGLVALVGSVAISYLYWQGRLSFNSRPGPRDRSSTLLEAIAELDDAFEADQVNENQYQAQRAKLKQELIEFMEAEQ